MFHLSGRTRYSLTTSGPDLVKVQDLLVYHFVYRDLRVELFFEKEGTTEPRDFDFKIGD